VAGCTTSNPNANGALDLSVPEPDLSVPLDLAAEDLASAADFASQTDAQGADLQEAVDLREPGDLSPVITTAHSIDTGSVADGQRVEVAGLVVTGVVRVENVTNNLRCVFGAYAQDPSGSAPDGVHLSVVGDVCTPGDAGSCRCRQPPSTNTVLDTITALGDVITVVGEVDIFTPVGSPVQHTLLATRVDKVGSGGTVTPLVFSNGSSFAKNGSGYSDDENMLVTIQPASAFTLSTVDNFGNFTGAGAQFTGYYRFYYPGIPDDNSMWTSITGIAQPSFGGAIAPRQSGDFVP